MCGRIDTEAIPLTVTSERHSSQFSLEKWVTPCEPPACVTALRGLTLSIGDLRMNKRVERYAWSDALVQAQADRHIKNGALLLAMKLAKAINWKPKDGRPAGLYWKNKDALANVGASRATYFEHRKALFDLGFFIEIGGNLIPQLPNLSLLETEQSAVQTSQSALETDESALKTPESALHNPLSVDTFSEDVLCDDSCSEDSWSAPPAGAGAPASLFAGSKDEAVSSLLGVTATVLDEVDGSRQSVVETDPSSPDAHAACPMVGIPSLHDRFHAGKPCPDLRSPSDGHRPV